ncbi:MAG TPA: hypothetical protein VGJ72_13340 [Polaromonas sp.]
MLHSIHSLHRLVAARDVEPRPTLAHRFARWLLCCWQAECRRAERPHRIVPYY